MSKLNLSAYCNCYIHLTFGQIGNQGKMWGDRFGGVSADMCSASVPPSLEQRLRRLCTVSIRSCCCFCSTVLLPEALPNWASISRITPLCLTTSDCSLLFSSLSTSSSCLCLVSISCIFSSRNLGDIQTLKGQ